MTSAKAAPKTWRRLCLHMFVQGTVPNVMPAAIQYIHGHVSCLYAPRSLEMRNERDAPIAGNCVVSAFGPYSPCSVTCGTVPGTETRTRTVLSPKRGAGADCPPLVNTAPCLPTVAVCPEGTAIQAGPREHLSLFA
jgi:hypothetical protein